MRKTMLSLLVLLFSINAYSVEFEEDGISYNYIPDQELSVSVANNGCKYFGDVVIPARVEHDGVTYTVRGIDYQAFFKCTDLSSVKIPATVSNFNEGYTFSQCTSLTSIELPANLTAVPNGMCWGCTSLKSISLPESITSIGEYAFATCSSLSDISMPSSVEKIGKAAFMGTAIENFVLPEKVTTLEPYVLALTTKLTNITLHDKLTSIGECAFQGNTVLKTVALPEGLQSIEASAFASCPSLSNITIPDGITSIPDKCFYNDMALGRIVIGKSVTTIGSDCFARYKNNTASPELKDVYLLADGIVSGGDSFLDAACQGATLHVVKSLVEAYRAQPGWNRFNIVAIQDGELSAISSAKAETANGGLRPYSIEGTAQNRHTRGIVIAGGQKFVNNT